MLTAFGVEVRKIRLDRGLRLLDHANSMEMSSSFLSAIETGKKPIPPGFVSRMIQTLQLSQEEAARLQRAADRSRTEVNIGALKGDQRELVAEFARKIDSMPVDLVEFMKSKIFKSVAGETPFRRRPGLIVDAISMRALWDFASRVRSVFSTDNQTAFPIMDLLEYKLPSISDGAYLDVCDRDEMGPDEGRVVVGQNCIKLRHDVYERAWSGVGRDRFTACHELGHFLLHRQVTMARTRDESVPVYRDAEWQADTFAGSLLLPVDLARTFAHSNDAAVACGMTPAAAHVMTSKYKEKGLF